MPVEYVHILAYSRMVHGYSPNAGYCQVYGDRDWGMDLSNTTYRSGGQMIVWCRGFRPYLVAVAGERVTIDYKQ